MQGTAGPKSRKHGLPVIQNDKRSGWRRDTNSNRNHGRKEQKLREDKPVGTLPMGFLEWTLLPRSKGKTEKGQNEQSGEGRDIEQRLDAPHGQRPELTNKMGEAHES